MGAAESLTTTNGVSLFNEEGKLLIGKGDSLQFLNLGYANRHGLIAGATGTGKTVTLQVLAEGFAAQGVPVFVADVKGDLSGVAAEGKPHAKVDERVEKIAINDFAFSAPPVMFWDVYGEQGHPIRATISEMGPLLLASLMDLSEAQEGVLHIAFAVADDEGWLLLDLKDLRAILTWISENSKEIGNTYGYVHSASVGAIQRQLLKLERSGADKFFAEPALDIHDFMRTSRDGKGYVNILAADKLVHSPTLYSTFLLWLLSELFETLPEEGDPEKPKLVFFFDEAHLLFESAPKALLQKVEQVVRLIRSKGVGVYFVTQNPLDVPTDVLGQLGNRIQHALRAFTPKDQKAVKVAAETFRENPAFDTKEVITQLGVGEALVSTLQEEGVPSIVENTLIRPPASRIGPLSPEERAEIIKNSPLAGIYDEMIDRESAFEMLHKRAESAAEEAEKSGKKEELERKGTKRSTGNRQGYVEAAIKTTIRSVSGQVGRALGKQILRGILGSFKK